LTFKPIGNQVQEGRAIKRHCMKQKWESIVTATLALCALVTTGVIVHRELFASAARATQPDVANPVFVNNWKSDISRGVQLGSAGAPVQLIEFADFECPFCSEFHKTVKSLRERYPTQVSLTYVHFPIPGHRFAMAAARAAECAGNQGRFEAMYDQLFEEQEFFGLKPWSNFAAKAGVPDRTEFDKCIGQMGLIPRVEAGKELGEKLGVKGTPTVIVNGWMLGRPPSLDQIEAMVKAVLAGRSPVTAVTSKS
jgi:protein-disulfide isomerase